MLSDNNLLKKEKCSKLSEISFLEGTKNTSYHNAIIIKELFKTNSILNLEKKDIRELIDDFTVPYSSKLSTKINEDILIKKLLRYSEFEKKLNKVLLRKSSFETIKINENDIKVSFDFILEEDGVIEVCKVKNSKTKLKKRGRSNINCISKSLELFLLQKAGELLYPNKKVFGKIVYLTSNKDKNNIISSDFETKEFENIARYSFNFKESAEMENRVIDLCNNTKAFCRNIKCEDCSMQNFCNFTQKNNINLKPVKNIEKANNSIKFSKEQQEFINFEEGILRVIAGAGSGKTTVISNRVINLIKQGYSIGNILLITYTTKGAEELKEKIEYWVDKNKVKVDTKKLNIFTFNSFGYKLIKNEYKHFGYSETPKMLDKITKFEIIKNILDNYPILDNFNYMYPFMDLFNAKGVVPSVAEIFDFIKSEGVTTVDEITDNFKISLNNAYSLVDMYLEYNDTLKNMNLIDYYDQVNLLHEIVSNKELLKKYGYQHIIVDEAQDTDRLQIQILSKMSTHFMFKSLVLCGDDSQAIFSWRGADNSNIIEFDKYFDNVKDIQMVENYRSTKEICQFANKINDLNSNKINKVAFSKRSGKKPLLLSGGIKTVAELVKKDLSSGFNLNDIAIIGRRKNLLIEIQNELGSIPNTIAVSELIIDNKNVKNILGLVNFLNNPNLTLHFAEYLQVAKYKDFINATDLKKFIEDEKAEFLKIYSEFKTDEERLNFFYSILSNIGKTDSSVSKLLEECKNHSFSDLFDLENFLNKLVVYKSDIFVEKSEQLFEAVTLTTVHSSKGKEFKKVYFLIDNLKYVGNTLEDEETRRLIYVASTRAKDELVIVGKDDFKTNHELYTHIENALA